jgi:hypothetical protein
MVVSTALLLTPIPMPLVRRMPRLDQPNVHMPFVQTKQHHGEHAGSFLFRQVRALLVQGVKEAREWSGVLTEKAPLVRPLKQDMPPRLILPVYKRLQRQAGSLKCTEGETMHQQAGRSTERDVHSRKHLFFHPHPILPTTPRNVQLSVRIPAHNRPNGPTQTRRWTCT